MVRNARAWKVQESKEEYFGTEDREGDLRKVYVKGTDDQGNTTYEERWEDPVTKEIMKADVLRRSAQFDKLIDEYEGKQYDNDLLNNIVKFQLYRAKEHDTGCYTVQHAIDYCTGAQA